MSFNSIRFAADAMSTTGFAAITAGAGAYVSAHTGLVNAARMVILKNQTDALLIVSMNGATDNIALAAGDQMILNICSNRTESGSAWVAGLGQRFFVKYSGAVATSGSLFISSFYGAE